MDHESRTTDHGSVVAAQPSGSASIPNPPEEKPPPKKVSRARKPKTNTYSDPFLAFWAAYPAVRKTKKPAAWEAWQKALTRTTQDIIMAAVKTFAKTPLGLGRYCPGPAPWLNQDRWDDDRESWQQSDEDTSRPHDPVDEPYKEY